MSTPNASPRTYGRLRSVQASPNSPRHAPGRGWVATRTYFVAVEGEDEDDIEVQILKSTITYSDFL